MYLFEKMCSILKEKKFTSVTFTFSKGNLEIKIDNSSKLKKEMLPIVKHFFTNFICEENLNSKKKVSFYGFTAKGKSNTKFEKWYKIKYEKKETFTFDEIKNQKEIKEEEYFKKKKNHSSLQINFTNPMKYVGQFNKEFLLVKWNGNLILVDQHALHERILLNSLIKSHGVTNFDKVDHLKQIACRNAIKFGDKIENRFGRKLVFCISGNPFVTACAHGRITMCCICKIK